MATPPELSFTTEEQVDAFIELDKFNKDTSDAYLNAYKVMLERGTPIHKQSIADTVTETSQILGTEDEGEKFLKIISNYSQVPYSTFKRDQQIALDVPEIKIANSDFEPISSFIETKATEPDFFLDIGKSFETLKDELYLEIDVHAQNLADKEIKDLMNAGKVDEKKIEDLTPIITDRYRTALILGASNIESATKQSKQFVSDLMFEDQDVNKILERRDEYINTSGKRSDFVENVLQYHQFAKKYNIVPLLPNNEAIADILDTEAVKQSFPDIKRYARHRDYLNELALEKMHREEPSTINRPDLEADLMQKYQLAARQDLLVEATKENTLDGKFANYLLEKTGTGDMEVSMLAEDLANTITSSNRPLAFDRLSKMGEEIKTLDEQSKEQRKDIEKMLSGVEAYSTFGKSYTESIKEAGLDGEYSEVFDKYDVNNLEDLEILLRDHYTTYYLPKMYRNEVFKQVAKDNKFFDRIVTSIPPEQDPFNIKYMFDPAVQIDSKLLQDLDKGVSKKQRNDRYFVNTEDQKGLREFLERSKENMDKFSNVDDVSTDIGTRESQAISVTLDRARLDLKNYLELSRIYDLAYKGEQSLKELESQIDFLQSEIEGLTDQRDIEAKKNQILQIVSDRNQIAQAMENPNLAEEYNNILDKVSKTEQLIDAYKGFEEAVSEAETTPLFAMPIQYSGLGLAYEAITGRDTATDFINLAKSVPFVEYGVQSALQWEDTVIEDVFEELKSLKDDGLSEQEIIDKIENQSGDIKLLKPFIDQGFDIEESLQKIAELKSTADEVLPKEYENRPDLLIAGKAINSLGTLDDIANDPIYSKKTVGSLPPEFRVYFNAKPEENISDVIRANRVSPELLIEARKIAGLSSNISSMQAMSEGLAPLMMYTYYDGQTGMIKQKSSSVADVIKAAAVAETVIEQLPSTPTEIPGLKMSSIIGGGRGDFIEYFEADRRRVDDKYKISYMRDGKKIIVDPYEFIFSRRDDFIDSWDAWQETATQGDESQILTDEDVQQFILDYAKDFWITQASDYQSGENVFNKLKENGYLDLYKILSPATLRTMTGDLDKINVVFDHAKGQAYAGLAATTTLNPWAIAAAGIKGSFPTMYSVDEYLSNQSPNYKKVNNHELGYLDRVIDYTVNMDGDATMQSQFVAQGFGFSNGEANDSIVNLGMASSLIGDPEEFIGGAAKRGIGTAYKGSLNMITGYRKVWTPDVPINTKIGNMAALGVIGASEEITSLKPVVGYAIDSKLGKKTGIEIASKRLEHYQASQKIESTEIQAIKGIAGSGASAGLGYLMAGSPAAIMNVFVNNEAAIDSLSAASMRMMGLSEKSSSVTGAISMYNARSLEDTMKDFSEIRRLQMESQGINPLVELYTSPTLTKNPIAKQSAHTKRDFFDATLRSLGKTPEEITNMYASVAVLQRETKEDVIKALMLKDRNALSEVRKRAKKNGVDPTSLIGLDDLLERSAEYNRVRKDYVATYPNKPKQEIDYDLANIRLAAMTRSNGDISKARDFLGQLKYEPDTDIFDDSRFINVDYSSGRAFWNTYRKNLSYAEEARLKAIGLPEALKAQEGELSLDDIKDYIAAQQYRFRDVKDLDTFPIIEGFNLPSAEGMKDYEKALVSVAGKQTGGVVFYKEGMDGIEIGEIHVIRGDGTNANSRFILAQALVQEKMLQGHNKFSWKTDNVFQQLQEVDPEQTKLFDQTMRGYFSSLYDKPKSFKEGQGKAPPLFVSSYREAFGKSRKLQPYQTFKSVSPEEPLPLLKSFDTEADKKLLTDKITELEGKIDANKSKIVDVDNLEPLKIISELENVNSYQDLKKVGGKYAVIFPTIYNEKIKPAALDKPEIEALKEKMISKTDYQIRKTINDTRDKIQRSQTEINQAKQRLENLSSGLAEAPIYAGLSDSERIIDVRGTTVLFSEMKSGNRSVMVLETADNAEEFSRLRYQKKDVSPDKISDPDDVKQALSQVSSEVIAYPKDHPEYGDLIRESLTERGISFDEAKNNKYGMFILEDQIKIDQEKEFIQRLQSNNVIIREGDTPESFVINNFHLVETFLFDDEISTLMLDIDHQIDILGNIVLTNVGKQQIADLLHWTRVAGNKAPSPRMKHIFGKIQEGFSQLFIQKSRVNADRFDPIPATNFEKKFVEYFNVARSIDMDATEITNAINGRVINEMKNEMQSPITNDFVEGMLKSSIEGNVSFKSVFDKTQRVSLEANEILRAGSKKESRAVAKLRNRANLLNSNEVVFELRPSKYVNVFYEENLIPERTRAKRNKAIEILREEGSTIDEASINARMESVTITPEDIDLAFFELVDEGANIDMYDLSARLMQYVEYINVQQNSGAKYISLTKNTFVREDKVQHYEAAAGNKIKEIFNVKNFDELAKRFNKMDDNPDLDANLEHIERQSTPYTMITNPQTISRLRSFLNQTQVTPGLRPINGSLALRIENGSPIKLYLYDLNEIREMMLDMAAPLGSTKAASLNSTYVHPLWSITMNIAQAFKKVLPESIVDKVSDIMEGTSDFIFENYSPMRRPSPWEAEEKFDPKIGSLLDAFQNEIRGIDREIQNVINMTLQKNSEEMIKKAEDTYGGQLPFTQRVSLRNIGVPMMELNRLLQRTSNPKVNPIFIPKLQKLNAMFARRRTNGQIAYHGSSRLSVESFSAKSQLREMTEFLKSEGVDVSKQYQIIDKYLADKMAIPREDIPKLNEAIRFIEQAVNEKTIPNDPLTLESWRNGLKKDCQQMLGIHRSKDQELAFEDLDMLLQKYPEADMLLEESDRIKLQKSIATILDGVQNQYDHVVQRGRTIYRSVVGKAKTNGEISPDLAITAYTLYHTGRINIGDIDIKRIRDADRFSLESPPDGIKWTIEDIVSIYKQYGFEEKKHPETAGAMKVFKSRFGIDESKLDDQKYLVDLANRIASTPPVDYAKSLMQLAMDQGDIALPVRHKTGKGSQGFTPQDLTKINLEIFVRLLAEEKYQNLLDNMTSQHMYGDIQKATREELIRNGLEPVTNQEALKQRVTDILDRYGKGDIYKATYENVGDEYVPTSPIDIAAQNIASEIITTYGLKPGKIENHEQITGPDGKKYFIPDRLSKEIDSILEDVAPAGKAASEQRISWDEFRERKYNVARMRFALDQAALFEERLTKRLIIDEDLTTEEANRIVKLYMSEKDPEFELKAEIEALNLEYDEMLDYLSEGFSAEAKKGLERHIDSMRKNRIKNIFGFFDPLSIKDQYKFFLDAEYEIAEARMLQSRIKSAEELPEDKKGGLDHIYIDSDLNYTQSITEYLSMRLKIWATEVFLPRADYGGKNRNTLGGFISSVNRVRKTAVTTGLIIPTPAYYLNNIFGALFQAYNTGGLSGISTMFGTAASNSIVFSKTIGTLFGKQSASRSTDVFITKYGRAYTPQMLANEIEKHGVGSAFIKTEMAESINQDLRKNNRKKYFSLKAFFSTENAYQDLLNEVANATDNFYRVATFMDQLDQGKPPSEAAKFARDTYFDYAALTDFEKKYVREFFLFYSFMRKNQIQISRMLRDNPQRVLNTLKFVRNSQIQAMDEENRDLLAEYEQTRLMYKGNLEWNSFSEALWLGDRYGSKVYIAPPIGTIDALELMTPFAASAIATMEPLYLDGKHPLERVKTELTGLAVYLGGQTSPVFKQALEELRGKQFFADRALDDIQITHQQAESINWIFKKAGFSIFNMPGQKRTGFIDLESDLSPYESDIRINEPRYKFSTEMDLLLYLVTMEVIQTNPLTRIPSSAVAGRQAKQTKLFLDMYESKSTDEPFRLPPGTSFEDIVYSMFSIRAKVLPTEDEAKRKLLHRFYSQVRQDINEQKGSFERK